MGIYCCFLSSKFSCIAVVSDEAEKFTSEMHDPCARSRCLQKITTQHKNTLLKAPVWSRSNTLRRLSQKSFYNSRVLERSQSRVPFYEEDVGAFYSSEVLPPFLVKQVSSLQSKSSPCRASLLESETWWASLDLRSVRGPTQRMGSTFFGPVDMGLLGSSSLISYFILFSTYTGSGYWWGFIFSLFFW